MTQRVFVAGHNGMVGSAICRKLMATKDVDVITKSRNELDLTDQASVRHFFGSAEIDQVYLAAAKVGGIYANDTYPADFIYENLMIQTNVINSAHLANVQKLLFLGSSCIYPREAPQPINEESLLSGFLEPTNEPYAISKIAGIKLCESFNRQFSRDYRSIMPTNLYGPNDNFHLENSHVIPALIRKFFEATRAKEKKVTIWGSGQAKREFLHVDDMAAASIFLMDLPDNVYKNNTKVRCSHINVGTGKDVKIYDLARKIADIAGFKGQIHFDKSRPDGPLKKQLDVSLLRKLGWSHSIELEEGLEQTFNWYARRG